MTQVPIWHGRVLDGGLLVLERPKDYGKYLRSFAGKHVELVLKRRRTKRTEKQSRYYFGVVVPLIAEYCGYEKDEMHELLAMKFLRTEDDPVTGSPRRKHTPDTDTKEFSEYVDACVRLAAGLGVVVPAPSEVAA